MAMSWFGRKPAPDRAVGDRIRAWAATACGGDPETRFSVNEIICRDPSCPGTETVILVMAPGVRTRALKIALPMVAVTEQDVQQAVMDSA
ncbi:hypothetical protein GCM10019059_31290 [Camelimonas fluminis]|uniref:Nitrate reductase n=1 Tax=Camelimonas fluminis TaxID=1576911 RepID=A0ABV7UMG3_9HYPH|nr:hypothetical protein [Camelimonas fluminis]GHE69303.1 hypothetical protein GCM10019059_31290 [Camelimonas fluminis]